MKHSLFLLFASLLILCIDVTFSHSLAQSQNDSAVENQLSANYQREVRSILDKRCVVCHGCYDAPCQLKMEDETGLKRGASKQPVYDGTRINAAKPTRLHHDAQGLSQWRNLGFHNVLSGADSSGDVKAGLMSKMLRLRRQNPLPDNDILPDDFDFSVGRKAVCPDDTEFDAFARDHPLWSMPFGLADLPDTEYERLQQWLASGASFPAQTPLKTDLLKKVSQWEAFFNVDGNKRQLVARYLYEHLFLARLYLMDAGSDTVYFKLLRSRTPPGQPIDIIATRRPYEDPGIDRVYYRLWRDPQSIVDKTHIPYALNSKRMNNWQRWFIESDYNVSRLPDYDLRTASNPFITFKAIPSVSRHRFLLDEAEFTIMNFIKGPVCRGSVALNVIQDHFWVFFSKPGFLDTTAYDQFLAEQDAHLRLPAGADSGIWSIRNWLDYARAQQKYLQAKLKFIGEQSKAFERGKIDVVWDGEGKNPNAALTVFRHRDSATVVKGLVGSAPKTAWLIDYPTLERIHYLLVAGFDVFGSASHQAMTRLYMDFLRMESEMNFLAFLPPETRKQQINFWYRDAVDSVRDYLDVYFTHDIIEPLHEFETDNPKLEILELLRQRAAPALGKNLFKLEEANLPTPDLLTLKKLNTVVGTAAALLPEIVFINIRNHGALTLLTNRSYSNIASMFLEKKRRLPAEDNLTLVNGFIGAHPNVLIDIDADEIPVFVEHLIAMRTEQDYSKLLDRFGVRRTSQRFWPVHDELYAKRIHAAPLSAGLFDLNRIENR